MRRRLATGSRAAGADRGNPGRVCGDATRRQSPVSTTGAQPRVRWAHPPYRCSWSLVAGRGRCPAEARARPPRSILLVPRTLARTKTTSGSATSGSATSGSPRQALPRQALPRQALPRQALPRQVLPRQVLPRQVYQVRLGATLVSEGENLEVIPKVYVPLVVIDPGLEFKCEVRVIKISGLRHQTPGAGDRTSRKIDQPDSRVTHH